MKQKLHKELQLLLDFYHQQRNNLHMSFDLVDNTPTTAEFADETTNQYNHACELPCEPPSKDTERGRRLALKTVVWFR